MHIRKVAFIVLISGYLILTFFSLPANPQSNTITVGDGGRFASIQNAINSAYAGDTIVVYSGTYHENLNVDKQLSIIGEDTGKGKPIVDAGGKGSAILLSAKGIVISGFAAMGSSFRDAGIKATSDDNIIKNCDLYDNYYGIYLFYSNNNTINSNNAHGNSYDGINLNQSSNNRVLNNTVSGNDHDGMRIERYSQANIIGGNIIRDNALSSIEMESKNAITIYLSDGNVVQGNTMENNGGMVVRESGTYRLGDGIMAMDTKGTIVKNNTMINNHYAVWIYHSTNATVTNNTATQHYYCMVVEDSSDVMVSDNVLSKGGRNARIISSSYVTFRNNSMSDGIFDMSIDGSHDILVAGNVLLDSEYDALMISNSNNNTIKDNRIVDNNGKCIVIGSSNDNDIYLNDIIGKKGTVSSTDSINRWESPLVTTYQYKGSIFTGYLGNHWSDYSGSDPKGNGIGDTAYAINGQNIDHYPLLKTYDSYYPPIPINTSITPTPVLTDSCPPQKGWDPWTFLIHLFNIIRYG